MKRFDKIHIEISNICNLHCSFCPEVLRPRARMEEGLFRRIIEQAAPLTEQVCFHLMGEPLGHPDFARFVEICAEHSVRIFLVTNGTLLRDKHVESLLNAAMRQINFSLHSFADNFPEQDPGPYLERIFAFTERAFTERPDLYVNYRLWNLEEPRAGSRRNQEILERVRERFGSRSEPVPDVRVQKSRLIRNRLYLHFDTEFTWPSLDLPVIGEAGRCHGLSSHFGILADGTVVPCCLDKEGVIPLGHVQESPLLEILEMPRARAMIQGFRERKLAEELCRRCPYIERFS